ncbi:hypothetical protein TrVE_jg3398 [Triparma verrucosa]|uniref:AMMECR1 domain-containing protein n=1 Tax=Triparma verrucosa TaxID=1606542 RepID=A0A9W7EM94_9STRA|nr:hypothetical protein TrVE_jg3398 [Triparma verrucosa]
MSLQSTPSLPRYAFAALEAHLSNKPAPALPPIPLNPCPPTPLFVTWEKCSSSSSSSSSPEWDLRGCIGTLSPSDLTSSLPSYVLTSALRDSRFSPISLSELPDLRCSVSLLVSYEACSDCYDWIIGTHGIIINFQSSLCQTLSATYLPEVALEHNMTKEYAVESLIRKSGYKKPITKSLLESIKTTRYQSSKCKVTYDEWKQTAL